MTPSSRNERQKEGSEEGDISKSYIGNTRERRWERGEGLPGRGGCGPSSLSKLPPQKMCSLIYESFSDKFFSESPFIKTL